MSSIVKRAEHWKHPDGNRATVAALAGCLKLGLDYIVDDPTKVYPSTDFKSGITMELLAKYKNMLKAFMALDRRGGYMGQGDVANGLTLALDDDPGKMDAFKKNLGLGVPVEDGISQVAYVIRVMLGHCRAAHDNVGAHEGHLCEDLCVHGLDKVDPSDSKTKSRLKYFRFRYPDSGIPAIGHCDFSRFRCSGSGDGVGWHTLQEIFNEMEMTKGAISDVKKVRREQRLACRQNPFIHFRTQKSEELPNTDDDTPEPEAPSRISTRYDPKMRLALMLLSDGNESLADRYIRGDRGFIKAEWFSPPYTTELEIANIFLTTEGRISTREQTGEHPAVMKKPASNQARSSRTLPVKEEPGDGDDAEQDAADNGDCVEEDAQAPPGDDEEGRWFVVKVLAGCQSSVLMLASANNSTDKAQILQVLDNTMIEHPSGWTAREVATEVANQLMVMPTIGDWDNETAVKGNHAMIEHFRTHAKRLKREVLARIH